MKGLTVVIIKRDSFFEGGHMIINLCFASYAFNIYSDQSSVAKEMNEGLSLLNGDVRMIYAISNNITDTKVCVNLLLSGI